MSQLLLSVRTETVLFPNLHPVSPKLSYRCVALQVNGVNIESMKHSDVVAFIKAGGDETWLLVVDPETDQHFKSRGVIPTSSHVRGRTTSSIRWSASRCGSHAKHHQALNSFGIP